MNKVLIALIGLFCTTLSFGQKGLINGVVNDSDGLAIPYASVYLEGTTLGTSTNENGVFLLKVPYGKYKLIVSALGYTTQTNEIEVTSTQLSLSFNLEDDITQLGTVEVSSMKIKSATATRSLLELQDIPQSIVVINQRVMQQQAAFDLTTIVRNMSGINFTGNYSGAGSYQFFNARGFDMVNSQNYRWNGMMIWNLGNNFSDNIEQVEFLKGPSSILFGDVAPGGVMNFSTKKPLDDFMVRFETKVGEWNLFRPALDVTGPLNKSKTVRYRLNTSYETTKSFRDKVSSEKFMVAPTIVADITKKLTFTAEAVWRNSTATDDPGLVSPDGTISGLQTLDPGLYLSEPNHVYKFAEQNYFTTLSYQFNDNWRIKAVGFVGNTENRPWGLWPDQPDSEGAFSRQEYGYFQKLNNSSATIDVLGTFYTRGIKHNLIFGIETQQTNFRYTGDGTLSYFDTNNLYNMIYGQVTTPEPTSNDSYLPFESIIRRNGFFIQEQLMVLDEKLHILAGFRYGSTEQGNDYVESELAGTDYEGYVDDIVKRNVFTPRVGLVFKPRRTLSFYASYAKGYEVNSPDIFAQNFADFSTPPATISQQLEIGTKSSIFDEKLGLTLSVFQINKKDPYGFVYLDPENPDFDLYNVYYDGHHRSEGIELDIDGKATNSISITAGAAFTNTKVIEDPGYPTGNRLPNAPRFTANFWLNYEPENKLKGFTAGIGYFYKSEFFSGIDNNPDLKVPGNYTLDLATGYTYKNFTVQVNVSNVTNRVAYLNPWLFNLFDVRPLRRTIITLAYTFKKK